jgi:hypothetical protein
MPMAARQRTKDAAIRMGFMKDSSRMNVIIL